VYNNSPQTIDTPSETLTSDDARISDLGCWLAEVEALTEQCVLDVDCKQTSASTSGARIELLNKLLQLQSFPIQLGEKCSQQFLFRFTKLMLNMSHFKFSGVAGTLHNCHSPTILWRTTLSLLGTVCTVQLIVHGSSTLQSELSCPAEVLDSVLKVIGSEDVHRVLLHASRNTGCNVKPDCHPVNIRLFGDGLQDLDTNDILGRLNAICSSLMDNLSKLISQGRLQEYAISVIVKFSFSMLSHEHIGIVRYKSIQVLQQVFYRYSSQRQTIFSYARDEMCFGDSSGMDTLQVPGNKDEGIKVQTVTVLILVCIQACVSRQVPDQSDVQEVFSLALATHWSCKWWQALLERKDYVRVPEQHFKSVIDHLVTDLFSTIYSPEWPSASYVLLCLCQALVSDTGIMSKEIQVRQVSIDLLGRIIAFLTVIQKAFQASNMTNGLQHTRSNLDKKSCQPSQDIPLVVDMCHSDIKQSKQEVYRVRQQLLEYLQKKCHTTHDIQECNFFLCLWWRSEVKPSKEVIDWYTFYKNAVSHVSAKNAPQVDARLSRISATVLTHKLLDDCLLLRNLDSMKKQVFVLMEDTSVSVRARAVTAFGSIAETEPELLLIGSVNSACKRRLSDAAISVRAAMIDVIGRAVLKLPTLTSEYYTLLTGRLTDVGVSVRVKVAQLLYQLIRKPGFPHVLDALVRVSLRIQDSDTTVQGTVTRIFRELWFSQHLSLSVEQVGVELIAVVFKIYTHVKHTGCGALPLPETFPITSILSNILAMERNMRHPNTCVNSHERCKKLCKFFLNSFLEHVSRCSASTCSPISQGCALSLQLLCSLKVDFCTTNNNPAFFMKVLHPYIMQVPRKNQQAQLQCMLAVIDAVTAHICHIPDALSEELMIAYQQLLIKHVHQGVLEGSVRCLCTLARKGKVSKVGFIVVMVRFYTILKSAQDSSLGSPVQHLTRAAYILGRLGHYGTDFIDELANLTKREHGVHSCPSFIDIFNILALSLSNSNYPLNKVAFQACGYLLLVRPRFWLSKTTSSSNFIAFMHHALREDGQPDIRQQAIQTLLDCLKFEQTGDKRPLEVDSSLPQRFSESYTNILACVIQQHLDALLRATQDDSLVIRWKTVQVLDMVLQQGLVHPLSILASLFVLMFDGHPAIYRTAARILGQTLEKRPAFLESSTSEGLLLAFQTLKNKCSPVSLDHMAPNSRSKLEFSGLNAFYCLIRDNTTSRCKFLITLLKPLLQDSGCTNLSYLLFCSRAILNCKFLYADEPLFIIYHLSNIVKKASSVLWQLQAIHANYLTGIKRVHIDPARQILQSSMTISNVDGRDHRAEDSSLHKELVLECRKATTLCIAILLVENLRLCYNLSKLHIIRFHPKHSGNLHMICSRCTTAFEPDFGILDEEFVSCAEFTDSHAQKLIEFLVQLDITILQKGAFEAVCVGL